jgi:hypothetical protein
MGPWPRYCFLLSGDMRFIKWGWMHSQVENTGCQSWRNICHHPVQLLVAAKPISQRLDPRHLPRGTRGTKCLLGSGEEGQR